MDEKEKASIITRLKSKGKKDRLYHNILPDEYKDDKDIIASERAFGIREITRIGYDVLTDKFYVFEDVLEYDKRWDEESWEEQKRWFGSFEQYYDYLDGKIYDNACYYGLDFSKITVPVDKETLESKKAYIEDTVDDHIVSGPSEEEIKEYKAGKRRKKELDAWVKRFIECDSLEALIETAESYSNSKTKNKVNLCFFFWQYVFFDLSDRRRFEIIMQYMSTGRDPEYIMIRPLCHVFDPNEVLEHYFPNASNASERRWRNSLKGYIEEYYDSMDDGSSEVSFDASTHYYRIVESTLVCRFFASFDELLEYRNKDLRNTDLSKDIELDYDFSTCITDATTKIPLGTGELHPVTEKAFYDGYFHVNRIWLNERGLQVDRVARSFEFFSDFVAYLNGDLSGADLISCEGLENLKDTSDLNFTDAKLKSKVCEKLGLKYRKVEYHFDCVKTFEATEKNESETALTIQQSSREITEIKDDVDQGDEDDILIEKGIERIHYISDLHLMHMLMRHNVKSEEDVICVIRNVVNRIVNEKAQMLLIGGDISSEYATYEMFVKTLREELNRRYMDTCVIFVLGNHDLWSYKNMSFSEIVFHYESLLNSNGMNLLQNNIIYLDSNHKIKRITNDELNSLSNEAIRERLNMARLILFGGLGFSGRNEEFNAKDGIYRDTVTREEEIEESRCVEVLYNKVLECVPDKRVIIFTHTPLECWNSKVEYHDEYIYVSGHTHRNLFHDDGVTRIYADNQVGYKNSNIHLKWFDVENDYDYFTDYDDGIYTISGEEYNQFYKGKNIDMTFTRDVCALYMLKKNGYYCFIVKNRNGLMSILNGGALRRVSKKDINYYFNNMQSVIDKLSDPLEKYTALQTKISDEIKRLGGTGRIHGCIIDIDWLNHIYLNPVDMKMTAYWAADMINKEVYQSVPALLEAECPEMFSKYTKLIKENSAKFPLITKGRITNRKSLSQPYLETDIYAASREIKKMQRLQSNILSVWYEIDEINQGLIERN